MGPSGFKMSEGLKNHIKQINKQKPNNQTTTTTTKENKAFHAIKGSSEKKLYTRASQASRCQGHVSRCAQLTNEQLFFLTVQPSNSDLHLKVILNSFPHRHQEQ